MLYIGKRPEKSNTGKVLLIIAGIVAGVATLTFVAYKLYKKYAPARVECECEDFLDDDDLYNDEFVEVECEEDDATDSEV